MVVKICIVHINLKYALSYIPIMYHEYVLNQILSARHTSKLLIQCLAQNKYLTNVDFLSFFGVQTHAYTSIIPFDPSLRIYPSINPMRKTKNRHSITSY